MPACCTSRRRATQIWASRWRFPSVRRRLTVSGFETFGDNQFATPITLFPDLRNQDKYQVALRPEPHCGKPCAEVRSQLHSRTGAGWRVRGDGGNSSLNTSITPTIMPTKPHRRVFYPSVHSARPTTASDGSSCTFTPAGDGSFSQNVQTARTLRAGLLASVAPPHRQLRAALSDNLRIVRSFGPQPGWQILPSIRCSVARFRLRRFAT